MKHKLLLPLCIMLATTTVASAQSDQEAANLIALSQSNKSENTIFPISATEAKTLDLAGFSSEAEFTVRGGVPNFLRKCEVGEPVRIAYIGGSITLATDQYRTQSANFIASLYPNVEMLGIGAGIGGTGADLGAARLKDQVLIHKPDLLFIEFAVNGANEMGVEGIVRQTIKDNPDTDICLIYTIYQTQRCEYAAGEIPFNIKRLEKVAEHYNLPSVHMGMWAGILETEGKLMWKATDEKLPNCVANPIIFSKDGVHAHEAGGDLYATAIARTFTKMKSQRQELSLDQRNTPQPHPLITPLSDKQMDRAKLIYPKQLGLEKQGWREIKCSTDNRFKRFEQWYSYLGIGDAKSEAITFTFEGDLLGHHNIGGPFGGDIDLFIDGKKLITTKKDAFDRMTAYKLVDPDTHTEEPSLICFNRFCGNIRNQYDMVKLEEGRHTVEIRINKQPIDKAKVLGVSPSKITSEYDQQCLYLGAIIINGDIVEQQGQKWMVKLL